MVTRLIDTTVDLRPVPLANITTMDFRADPFAEITVTLFATQFGPGLILNTVLWDGGLGTYGIVVVEAAALDASAWQFTGWTANDIITLTGTSGQDKIFGSVQADRITGGNGNDVLVGGLGRDTLFGGAGNDTFRVSLGEFPGGEIYDGGSETLAAERDVIELQGQTGTYDFTALTLVDIEAITATGSASESVLLTHAQFASLDAIQLGSGADTLTVSLAAGQTLDLRAKTLGLTGIETWTILGGGSLLMTGAQFNQVTAVNATSPTTLELTAGSARLGAMADAQLTGVGSISIRGATVTGQVLDLRNQTEGLALIGSALTDTILGGSGDDTLRSSGGPDSLSGGAGNDIFLIEPGIDIDQLKLDGGANGTVGDRDLVQLTGGLAYDLTRVTLTGIETIKTNVAAVLDETLTVTLGQALGATTINWGRATTG